MDANDTQTETAPAIETVLPAVETAPETFFESFYDDDSGVWSLRRVSTIPPQLDDAS